MESVCALSFNFHVQMYNTTVALLHLKNRIKTEFFNNVWVSTFVACMLGSRTDYDYQPKFFSLNSCQTLTTTIPLGRPVLSRHLDLVVPPVPNKWVQINQSISQSCVKTWDKGTRQSKHAPWITYEKSDRSWRSTFSGWSRGTLFMTNSK